MLHTYVEEKRARTYFPSILGVSAEGVKQREAHSGWRLEAEGRFRISDVGLRD